MYARYHKPRNWKLKLTTCGLRMLSTNKDKLRFEIDSWNWGWNWSNSTIVNITSWILTGSEIKVKILIIKI